MKGSGLLLLLTAILVSCEPEIKEDKNLLASLMNQHPDQFSRIITEKDSLEVQVIYTMIDRDEQNNPVFRSFYFNVDSSKYFYPASTIKLPMSLLALEKINQLGVEGLDKNTPMFHDSVYYGQLSVGKDSTSETGLPSIAHYIKKILIASDNDAFNRLYEFLGQQEANAIMNRKGYPVRFLHRLERALPPDQNRHTEAVRFMKDGKLIYDQTMLINLDSIKPPSLVFKGKGFMKDIVLVKKPFDFTYKNFYSLVDQQKVLRTVLFPEAVLASGRFDLTQDDYRFLYTYMSQLPSETLYPPYARDTAYYDAYSKFLMYAGDHSQIPGHIRIFNKSGDAYGYLIDNAYVVDFKNGVEFMLSAVINTNTDGVYNDGKYEYETLGYPFFRNLGQLIYQYELKRKREIEPNLSRFAMKYDSKRP